MEPYAAGVRCRFEAKTAVFSSEQIPLFPLTSTKLLNYRKLFGSGIQEIDFGFRFSAYWLTFQSLAEAFSEGTVYIRFFPLTVNFPTSR